MDKYEVCGMYEGMKLNLVDFVDVDLCNYLRCLSSATSTGHCFKFQLIRIRLNLCKIKTHFDTAMLLP